MSPEFQEKLLASYPRDPNYPNFHYCPRGEEIGQEGKAVWEPGPHCSWCGSLHPDWLMDRIEAGTVILEPTDKNYKIYVQAIEGSAPWEVWRRAEGDPGGDDPSKWVWTPRPSTHGKFYFQHFSIDQRKHFVDLLNAKQLKLGEPGYFYRRPFFIALPESK